MTTSIENNFLKININQKGGELTSLFCKEKNTEILWQGNPEFWNGQSPILFPIVGELKNGYHTIDGKNYEIPRHGLVRKSSDWEIIKIAENQIDCIFKSSPETLIAFPFSFQFKVSYLISGKTLKITKTASNLSKDVMPVSIGAHPAFNCDLSNNNIEDYSLEFEQKETSSIHLLNEKGLLLHEEKAYLNNQKQIQLSKTIFNDDALVFKKLKSNSISLIGPEGKILKMDYQDYPYLGIWSKPNAPFVCIEPWIGHADYEDASQNLMDKPGVIKIDSKSSFSASYSITLT